MSPRPRRTKGSGAQARTNPFAGVNDYFSETLRVRTHGIHGAGSDQVERTHASAWVPPTDILAVGNDLVIRIDLAGVDPDLVELNFSHGLLTVSGSRPAATDDGSVSYYTQERYHGEFRRLITLPEGTAPERISAQFENGLVEITVTDAAMSDDSTRIRVESRPGGIIRRTITGA